LKPDIRFIKLNALRMRIAGRRANLKNAIDTRYRYALPKMQESYLAPESMAHHALVSSALRSLRYQFDAFDRPTVFYYGGPLVRRDLSIDPDPSFFNRVDRRRDACRRLHGPTGIGSREAAIASR
jgi:hypothetical protein